MYLTLDGDIEALERFGQRVGRLGSDATARAINVELADESLNLVQQGFAREQDPYGRPWYPKKFPDGRRILRGESGRLEKSWVRLYVGPDCAIIGSRVWHSRFAQSGTGIFGPSHQPIRPKRAKALRFRVGFRFYFARQVDGSPQRMMVPMRGVVSPIWMRAMQSRLSGFLMRRYRQAA